MNGCADLDPRIALEIRIDPVVELADADGRWRLHLLRDLRHDLAQVWAMLTEPDRLSRWSLVVPDRPLTTIGPATSTESPISPPRDAEVLKVVPQSTLWHRWDLDELHWDISANDRGTRFELFHLLDDGAKAADLAASWRCCFGSLAASYDHSPERVVGRRALDYGWQELRDDYETRFGQMRRGT